MITPEQEAQILRYFHAEGWRVGTIATQLGVHHCTVRRVLAQQGVTAARASTRRGSPCSTATRSTSAGRSP